MARASFASSQLPRPLSGEKGKKGTRFSYSRQQWNCSGLTPLRAQSLASSRWGIFPSLFSHAQLSVVQKEEGFKSGSSLGVGGRAGCPHRGCMEMLKSQEHDRIFKPKAPPASCLCIDGTVAPSSRHHLQLHFLINVLPNFPWLPVLPLSVTLLITDVSLHQGKREEKLFFQGDS